MGGDNFDKSSKGEIIDFYEADRLFREYVESEYDKLIWDIHEHIKRAASNGETQFSILRTQAADKIEQPESEILNHLHRPSRPPMIVGYLFRTSSQIAALGEMLFSERQSSNAYRQIIAYFMKLGYDVSKPSRNIILIKWDRVDRRKFP